MYLGMAYWISKIYWNRCQKNIHYSEHFFIMSRNKTSFDCILLEFLFTAMIYDFKFSVLTHQVARWGRRWRQDCPRTQTGKRIPTGSSWKAICECMIQFHFQYELIKLIIVDTYDCLTFNVFECFSFIYMLFLDNKAISACYPMPVVSPKDVTNISQGPMH